MNDTIVNVAETFSLTEDQTMSGVSPLQRRNYSPKRAQAIVEAANMWRRVFDGDRRATLQVHEALSTSDLFVSATGDVLDRELLGQYAEQTPEWQSYSSRTVLRNFKPKKLRDILGGRSALEAVPELTEYPYADLDNREYQISVGKFGRRFGFSWEAMVNDDLDELQQIPGRFASASAITEDVTTLAKLANITTGVPNAAFFKDYTAVEGYVGMGLNTTPVTDALTEANLATALTAVNTRKVQGNLEPPTGGLILVVGPAQEMTARRILNASELRVTVGGTTTVEPNYLKGAVELVVLRRLAGLAWFVLPKPNSGRPAFVTGFLRGHETPDIRVKNAAGKSGSGGGDIDPTEGSFDEDGVWYRVRHVTGAGTVDPLHTYAATGTE